ncbi:P-loop NTPase [Halobacteria archaeon AArc-m2/3/4]|uniref:P-loop NTPase n=1 Tax=Natronoglomus mannanivorans TaxID=2979990 RepID=A0ABT2QEN0_9EURY|nr:P-loop NTPase [Halobacteria archaeon AArc-m2/3/4]
MIAIAGAKGGCGKSTVTLGLAEAFARADTPALAIDADRQLPNLHVMVDLDRTPTVATLGSETDVRELAQQHPRVPNVGIVPAPTSAQTFEYGSLGESLDADGVQVLIDCPSGAGPDVVDPLSQAAGVIVVTTHTDRSLEAAEMTIEMARRLGVPVYGAVLNQCSEVPDRATRWEGVPLLGCVPERPSPAEDGEVDDAFDDIVERLVTQSPTDRASPAYAGDRLPIGTTEIDHRLGGGLPPGSVVALVADPASQAEHVLYRATDVRGTLYLSTERSRKSVRRAIESSSVGSSPPTIRHVADEGALEEIVDLIGKLPNSANLIVDSIDDLERRDRSAYVSFLDELTERIAETGGLAILHCLEEIPNRSATLRAADAVFELETVAPGIGTDVEHYLSVPKYRPDASFTETIALEFGERSSVGPIESPPEPADGG